MDRGKYAEKCMNILNPKQFVSCKKILQKLEMKIQRADRKIKNKLSPKEYLNIYPSGSSRGNFYGTAQKINLHQLEH